ncbi:MAG: type transport system ATP-binding protein [Thermoplasmata archaeon]|jgi:ABC-2 type transport system ATP-binding protein|nr:type transport system ATP-binding protein [Thermoplasmata archaeon]
MDLAVRGTDVGFQYAGRDGHAALRGCSFHVRFGEVYGVLGPNGAGKTTLLKLLATLLIPGSGELEVLGHSLPREEAAVRAHVGVAVGEYERTFHYRLSCEQNLRYFAAYHPALKGEAVRRRVHAVLEASGLLPMARRPYGILSQGMKHRLAVARALLPSPRLLLLDEPTSGVDAETTASFLAQVRAVADAGTAVVFTTHRLPEASRLCDRILLLRQGRPVAEAAPDALRRLASSLDVVHVRLASPPSPAVLGRLTRLEGVRSVDAGAGGLRIQCDAGGAAPQEAVALLRRAGCRAVEVQQGPPTLEDAFRKLTGAP